MRADVTSRPGPTVACVEAVTSAGHGPTTPMPSARSRLLALATVVALAAGACSARDSGVRVGGPPTTVTGSATGPSTTGPSTTGPSTTGPSTTGPSTTGPTTTGPSTTG